MTSGRAIDHVVLAVQDLDRTASRYQKLGFTLTPRAAHEGRMGTSNRLAQFRGRNFIELLEVDRPEGLARHDFGALPPFFSFGDHNRIASLEREGLSMMVFVSDDARADILSFSSANLPTFAPFDFERYAKLPDGAQVTVAFSLGFVQSPEMPRVAFFVCENRAQGYFWKPEYQSHANGATGIVAVYLSSCPRARCGIRQQNVRGKSQLHPRRLQRRLRSFTRAACFDAASRHKARQIIPRCREGYHSPSCRNRSRHPGPARAHTCGGSKRHVH
jgi:hypothetical protein